MVRVFARGIDKSIEYAYTYCRRYRTMPGTKDGARKATQTKLKRYGKDFFSRMGKKGGNPVLLEQRAEKVKRESR